MTIYGCPDIVTDDLVLHLDAANSKSYGGSGTARFNVAGNIKGTRVDKFGRIYLKTF